MSKFHTSALLLLFAFASAFSSVFAHEEHKDLHHWEIPSKDPDRIILTFLGDPATSRAVTWRTDDTDAQRRLPKSPRQRSELRSLPSQLTVSMTPPAEPFDLGDPQQERPTHRP